MRSFSQSFTRWRRPALLLVLVFGAATSAGLLTRSAADLQGSRVRDRNVTRLVALLMKDEHLSRRALDDEMSRRGLDGFLKTLDRMKLYFYQSDVQDFLRRRDELDDMVNKGDLSFAHEVFQRYLQRIDERVKLVDELLAQDLDFTLQEEFVRDPDLVHYPQDEKESRERWRRRIKWDLLLLKTDKLEGEEARRKLSRRYHSFAKRMRQTDSDELMEMFLNALTTCFDPHTSYMSPSALANFRILMSLELEGIGAALSVSDDGYTVVTKVIKGGAADKHGKLKADDRIVGVGQGEDGEMVDVVDMKLGDVVKLIRGRAGTIVRLAVIPEDSKETESSTETKKEYTEYTITRAKIELRDSEARGEIIPCGDQKSGSLIRVGFIDLPSFYMDMEGYRNGKLNFRSTTRDVRKILEDFKKQNVDAVMLDLRHNGGGSLTEAIQLTGLFIDYGPVVQVKGADGRVQHYDDRENGMAWDGPLVVLTSKFSASASEILAGAIQDYRRGLIVGDKSTHGKGTVQSLLDLGAQLFRIPNPPENLGALKLTMQQFYRPNGDSTQKRGVLADIVLPSMSSHMDVGEADLDYAIEFDRITAARYAPYKMVDADMLSRLRELSAERCRKSEKFAELREKIERYVEHKDRKTMSLNEKEFFAEREKLDAEKEEEKELEAQNDTDDTVFERNFYSEELLAITCDYVGLLSRHKIASAN